MTKKAAAQAKRISGRAKLGGELRKLRLAQKWTLRDVAEKTKLSHEAVRLVEMGRGGVGGFMRVLVALDLPSKKRHLLILRFVFPA